MPGHIHIDQYWRRCPSIHWNHSFTFPFLFSCMLVASIPLQTTREYIRFPSSISSSRFIILVTNLRKVHTRKDVFMPLIYACIAPHAGDLIPETVSDQNIVKQTRQSMQEMG